MTRRFLLVLALWDGPTETDPAKQIQAAPAFMKGVLKAGDTTFTAGLQNLAIEGDNILLATSFTFTKDNVDGFDF